MSTHATNPSRGWSGRNAPSALHVAQVPSLALTRPRTPQLALPAAIRIAWEIDPGALRSAGALDGLPELASVGTTSIVSSHLEVHATLNSAGRSHAEAHLILSIATEPHPRECRLLSRRAIQHRLSHLPFTSCTDHADAATLLHLDGAHDPDGMPWLRVTILLDNSHDAPTSPDPRPADILLAATTLLCSALNLPGGVYQPPRAEALFRA